MTLYVDCDLLMFEYFLELHEYTVAIDHNQRTGF